MYYYATMCSLPCFYLDAVYEQLASALASVSSKVVIAKIDASPTTNALPPIIGTLSYYPMIHFFKAGSDKTRPVEYPPSGRRSVRSFVQFLKENGASLPEKLVIDALPDVPSSEIRFAGDDDDEEFDWLEFFEEMKTQAEEIEMKDLLDREAEGHGVDHFMKLPSDNCPEEEGAEGKKGPIWGNREWEPPYLVHDDLDPLFTLRLADASCDPKKKIRAADRS